MKKRAFTKKIFSVILCTFVIAAALIGCRIQYVEEEDTTSETVTSTQEEIQIININLWYSDEELGDYINMCAEEYEQANRNVNISTTLVSESGYADAITQQAINDDDVDLYIIDNDKLEQMKLSGLADENEMADIYSVYNYSPKALNACIYKDRLIAYPLTFNTSFVIYNADLVGDAQLTTFDDIKTFADGYETTMENNISRIFSCDLDDIFYNYGYLGAYLEIGGQNGDDKTQVYEVTSEISEAVSLYQQLIEFFYIDINEVDYYTCLTGFENGSIMFTVGDNAMYLRVKDTAQFNVGVMPFPDMTEERATSPLSVTTSVVVNPFSDNVHVAESFAKYLTYTNAEKLYTMTGKIPCRIMEYEDENIAQIYASYDKSTPKLKVMYNDEFYALLEVAMHLMASGDDDVDALSAVGNYLEAHWGTE